MKEWKKTDISKVILVTNTLQAVERGCVKSSIINAVIANEVKQSINIQIDCFGRASLAMTGERLFTQPRLAEISKSLSKEQEKNQAKNLHPATSTQHPLPFPKNSPKKISSNAFFYTFL